MRILTYQFETTLQFSEAVCDHSFVLRCMPKGDAAQTVMDAQIILTPHAGVAMQIDGFGNRLQVGRLSEPHDSFDFISSGMVVVDPATDVPEPVYPMYLRHSRYADADEAIAAFAAQVIGDNAQACSWDHALALADALHARLAYEKGATDVTTSATQAFALGKGVCQDFSHIYLALCRCAGLPARYVNGLMLGEGATHAWVEVHDGVRWRGVDPTNDRVVDDTYIALSRGRDFSDCPIESGVFTGGARQEQQVMVRVAEQ